MTELELSKRMGKIETSLAVLATSATNRDEQFETMTAALTKHTDKEEILIGRIFDRLDETKNACDEKHADVNERFARQDGAIAGAKYVMWFVGALASISLFLGIKGFK